MASSAASARVQYQPVPVERPRVAGGSIQAVPPRELELPSERFAWDALAQLASEPNPFFESWYLLPALRELDGNDAVSLLRFDFDGELAGLMPLRHERRYYRWPLPQISNWLHGNCFLGQPLVARGLEREFWRALLNWADADPGSALFLHLAELPLSGRLWDALCAVLDEQGRDAAVVHRKERAMLTSQLSPEAYFEASLSGKKRKELRRQHARLAELGALRFERRRDDAGLAAWTDQFLALEHAGWKGGAGSSLASDPATERLLREALTGAAQRGRLERLTLTLSGTPIAMLITFLTAPGAFSYKTAFDERYARFSPGVLLQRENLELLADPAVHWCDSCAAADHPMIERIWREKRAIGRISIAIGGSLRRAVFAGLVRAELGHRPIGLVAAG